MDKLLITPETAAEKLADCKVGDTKEITMTVKVTRFDDTWFEADVTSVDYVEPSEGPGEGEAEAAEPIETAGEAEQTSPRRPAAVIAVLGKGK